jgi:beta-glucosidase
MKLVKKEHFFYIKVILFLFIIFISLISCKQRRGALDTREAKEAREAALIDRRIEELLSLMTLEEKVGQMVNIGLPTLLQGDIYYAPRDTSIIDTAKLAVYIGKYGVGSVHNTPGYPPDKDEWYRLIKQVQDYAINHTRLGIPVIYGIDGVHGANFVDHSTMLPQQIALAASWDTGLAERAGEITAYELRAASMPWNYAPVIDVAPQPLWGRMFESFGEDPYLISQMSNAFIRGAQGDELSDTTKTAVCIKHYVGYGAGINGKDKANAFIPENYLRQYYLPPFTEAIKNDALTVMLSSNSVNGIPCNINKYYITDILKGELGFRGFTVSDFSDIEFLVDAHQVAHDKREATKMAVLAGLDMIMNPYNADVADMIVDLVYRGEIPVSRINDAVSRILLVKLKLNLFEKPYNDPGSFRDFGTDKLAEDNYKSAAECITLLKNNNVLPLPPGCKILVTGVAANSMNCLNGAWSRTFQGVETEFNDPSKLTILDALKERFGKGNVRYIEGTDYEKDINTKEAVRAAAGVDYIIACLGEMPATEKPSDINELPLPLIQQNLIKELGKTGKPVILVLVEGRPRIIRDIEPLAQGIILAYLPGDEGGRALASIISGDINPSGKMPVTYPKYTGNALTYWHKKADIRDRNWGYNGFYPQYEFGYGLSYTTFQYSDLKLSVNKPVSGKNIEEGNTAGDNTAEVTLAAGENTSAEKSAGENTAEDTAEDTAENTAENTDEITLPAGDSLYVSVDVTNTGDRDGKEVVEIYIRDLVATVSPDVLKLVRFNKVNLKPGETKTVEFVLYESDLAFVNADNKWITESGYFTVFAGGNPAALLQQNFLFLK